MTLYVVPALYLLIARNTRSPEYMSRLIDGLRGRGEPRGAPPTASSAARGELTPSPRRHARVTTAKKPQRDLT